MTNTCPFVFATSEDVAYIRKQLGTDEEDIRRAVTSLREWLRMQPHLPDKIDDEQIERMYINCKCSVERVKVGMDAYFSLKTRFPEILMQRDPVGADIEYTKQHVKMLTMPRLTKQAYRVHIVTEIDPDSSTLVLSTYGKVLTLVDDMMQICDYSLGDVCIIDLATVNAGHILRADVNVVRALEVCHKTAYCRRLKGLHFINAPKIIDSVLKLVKVALSKKLQQRIFVHLPGSTTLFKHVDPEWIPDELGGTAGPADKFNYVLLKTTEELRDWFLEQDKYTSDESRRPAESHYVDSTYGIAGSFKKLSVD